MAATEFEVLYGGAKGGAKTESLVVAPLQQTHHPGFKGLLLREVFKELREMQERCAKYYKPLGAEWRDKDKQWRFPSGAFVEVGFCEDEKDVTGYQGREWTFIGYDEMGNLRDENVWAKLTAEIRSPYPELVTMARGSANPGGKGHAWLKRRLVTSTDYGRTVYTDPVTGLKRRFIPSRVTDNPIYANDAKYMAILRGLPELMRRQLLEGDWDAGAGMLLDELNRDIHVVDAFPLPAWWYRWGALDIGFRHNWCFVHGAMDEQGQVYIVDALHGRQMRPDQVFDRIRESTFVSKTPDARPTSPFQTVMCDSYARIESNFRGDRTPSVRDQFADWGLYMDEANQKRVSGLNNLRMWLAWRGDGGKQLDGRLGLKFFRTPGNAVLIDCLESMVVDPKNVEDALKVDSDENGNGGDDPYDALRYLMASHPFISQKPSEVWKPGPDQDPQRPEFIFPELGSAEFSQLPDGF